MKTCSDCGKTLPLSAFTPKASCRDGYEPRCKVCRSIRYNKSTPALLCKKIYNSQIGNSTKRNHQLPSYTLQELINWVLGQPQFASLFDAWQVSGYNVNLAPTVDRLDDAAPYSLTNIQLLTWEANRLKAANSKKENTLLVNHRAVAAYTPEGVLYKKYASMAEAMREFGGKATQSWGISSVCNGTPVKDGNGKLYTPRTYKGLVWKWI